MANEVLLTPMTALFRFGDFYEISFEDAQAGAVA
jgi:DNA mismatch repair ATPase MutS